MEKGFMNLDSLILKASPAYHLKAIIWKRFSSLFSLSVLCALKNIAKF
ncbi:hypothetical protein JW926_09565 [Candidatus Sumerlaeota bacterium]|nr:hypothetical protein [Candidatus Sumerlaeota bacterium]